MPRGGGVRVKASGDSTVGQEMPINIFICRGVLTPLTGTDNTPGPRDTTRQETCSYTIHRYEKYLYEMSNTHAIISRFAGDTIKDVQLIGGFKELATKLNKLLSLDRYQV